MVELGNLVLGIQIPGLAMLDALDARLAVMDRTQHMVTIGVNTGAVTAAEAQVTSLGTAHQALNKTSTLGMDFSQVTAARSAAQGLDGDIVKLGASLANLAAPAALAAGLGLTTKAASDLSTEFSQLQANTTLTNAQMEQVTAGIKELASTTPTGITQLSDAFRIATNEGFSTADAMKLVTAANESAVSTGAQAADVTNALAIAMHDFHIPAAQAGEAMNVLHLAAAEGNVTLEDFASNSAKVWADAGKLGVAFTDAAGALSALTQSGYSAAQASTMLDGLMQKIIAPTAASRAEIEQLSRATGVDLVTDFTQAGIAARGLPQVLTDIQIATGGNVTEMEKLIPAMRGGRGEIALTSAAGIDFKGVISDLADTMSGKTNPTADAFARAMGLTSSQMGVFLNQLRLAAADMGQTFIPAATDVLKILDSLGGAPEKALIGLGLLAAAIKTVSVAGDLLSGTWERLTATTVANTVATGEQVVATDALAAAAPLATIAVEGETAATLAHTTATETDTTATLANNAARAAKNLLAMGAPAVAIGEGINAYSGVIGDLKNGDFKQAFGDFIKNEPASPQGLISLASSIFGFANPLNNLPFWRDSSVGQNLNATAAPGGGASGGGTTGNSPASMRSPADQYASQLDYSKQATADAKTAAANQAAYEKALFNDVAKSRTDAQAAAVKAEKDGIQEAADAQVAAATKSADAWKAANAEVGKVDISKGLSALGDAAPALDRVVSNLAAIGESDAALSNLTGIADIFKGFGDEVDKATAALDGYNLTLNQTNDAIKAIGSLKGEYMAALDAAQRRVANGTADDSDRQIIAMRSSALGTLDSQTTRLQQAGNQDIIGKLTNLPDYVSLDAHLRSIVASNGGGAGIIAKVNLDKTNAESDLTRFEQQDRAAVVQIKAYTKDAIAAVDKFLAGIPTDKTVTIHTMIQDAPGSTSMAQGNDGNGSAPPGGGAGDWNAFHSLTPADFNAIAQSGAMPGTTSPFAGNPAEYAAVMAAAQQYGVDPRALLAFTHAENHNGTDISPELAAANNFSGIKYPEGGTNTPGESRGPMSPEGDNYAAFATPATFWNTLAANLATGAYAGDHATGGAAALLSVANRYVGQPGSDNSGRVSDYYNYATQYPEPPYSVAAQGGYGAPITRAQGYGPGDTGLGSGQTPTGGAAADAVAGSVRDQIVQKALQSVGQDKLVDYCEQFVEETVQAITGKRGATGVNQNSATEAFNAAQSQGLVRPANQAPQAGDLVYYPGASSSDPGHVAIYVGNGQQVSTYDKGAFPGNSGPDHGSGTNAANALIHQESISPGARFVMVPGTASDTTNRSNTPDVRQGFPGSGTVNAAQGGTPTPPPIPPDFSKAAEDLSAALAKLDPAALKDAGQQFATILPALTRMQENKISTDPANLTATDKQNALNAATQQGLVYETAYANLVRDVEDHTGNIKDDVAKIAADVGGPMAAGFGAAALASAQLAASQDQITKLQDAQKAADAAQQGVTRARTLADQADSRAQTIAGWGQQAAQNALTDRQTAENLAYTQTQRDEQDAQRRLQFSQQVQATDLQNKLTDLQKSQQSTVYQRTSAEQLQQGVVSSAATNQAAGVAAAALAAMHDHDLAQKDLDTKAVDAIQLQIREQAKAANLESYNLQTETIQAQRAHEDKMAGFTAEGTALARTAQQAAQNHTIAQWRLQDTRTAEDAKYQAEKDANTAAQQAETAIGKTAQASLDTATQALSVWQSTGAVVAIAANQAGAAANNYAANPTYTRTLGTHAAGGSVSGWGIVGDSPGGDMTNAEAVYGSYTVIPHDASVRAGLISGASGGSATPSMTVNLNLGDVGLMLSDADKKEINDLIAAKVDAARRAGVKQARAMGR